MENFQNDCCHPWTKNSFRTRVQGCLESVNAVVTLIGSSLVRSIDRNLFFSKTKATQFKTMMTTVKEVNSEKTKVPDKIIFRSVLLDCFTAELDE